MGIRSLHNSITDHKKIIYSVDENFSYGYNENFYNLRESSSDKFSCYYQKAQYVPTSFKEESIKVCEKISDYAKKINRVPVVLLSGGLDSEVVVRSFVDSGKDFSVITNRFFENLNAHELYYIEKLSKKYNLSVEYKDLDVINWLVSSDESNFLAHESKCLRPQMLPTLKLLIYVYEQGGFPVLGNGDLYASKEINPQWRMSGKGEKYIWNYIEYEYILAWLRYCVRNNIEGSINFFQQTPEIVLAMALDPMIQDLVKNNPVGKQSTRSTKYLVYKKYWNDVELRPKFHGGENIDNVCDYIQKTRLNKFYRSYNDKYKLGFDNFVNRLMPL
jgi:hypothetical protein